MHFLLVSKLVNKVLNETLLLLLLMQFHFLLRFQWDGVFSFLHVQGNAFRVGILHLHRDGICVVGWQLFPICNVLYFIVVLLLRCNFVKELTNQHGFLLLRVLIPDLI